MWLKCCSQESQTPIYQTINQILRCHSHVCYVGVLHSSAGRKLTNYPTTSSVGPTSEWVAVETGTHQTLYIHRQMHREKNTHRVSMWHDNALIALTGNLAHYMLTPRQSWKLVSRRRCEIRFLDASKSGNGFSKLLPCSEETLMRAKLQAGPKSSQ